jgi:hypothetical protein
LTAEGRLKKYEMRKFPSVFAAFVLTAGSLGILITRNLVEVFLCAELITIALFYIFFTATIPVTFAQKQDPEAIFIGGAGKPPYISADELYSPRLSVIPDLTQQNEKSIQESEQDIKERAA